MLKTPIDNRRILLVDDDDIFTVMVEAFLSSKNVFFDSVGDLKQAKDLLTHTSFDLVLLDNYLPDGFGNELLFFLQDINVDTPVIMITADDDQVSMQKCFEEGVDDYLLKPIHLELMWLKITRCIKSYLIEQQLSLQNKKLEVLIDQKQHEENLARHVYKHFASSASDFKKGIRTYLQPSGAFNGDFFIDGESPNGNYIMILVDATGHGLAAAMTVLPVVSTARAMLKKGFSLESIIYEINTKVYDEVPDDRFVACIGIEVNFLQQDIGFFNGGMPDILIIDDNCTIIDRVKSAFLPLGIMSAKEFYPAVKRRTIQPNEHLLFFSDGLTEQTSVSFEAFSKTEFEKALVATEYARDVLDNIMTAFQSHGHQAVLGDDVSLCYVDVDALSQLNSIDADNDELSTNESTSHVKLSLDISGEMLAKTDIVELVDGVINSMGLSVTLRQKSFTIFSELINNGFDHGILNLDSGLKNDIEGFANYLEERENRMDTLCLNDKLTLNLEYEHRANTLLFSIEDSGKGYEPKQANSEIQTTLSGRGIALVKKLSEQFILHQPGNKTSVLIK